MSTDDPSLVGEAAHIVAEEPAGPRGNSSLTSEQRNKYENLILLCCVHHKQVDDHVNDFTVEKLKSSKAEHELWVRTALAGFDAAKQADDEQWAGYIEQWGSKADLDNWLNQTYSLMQAQPGMSQEFWDRLDGLRQWILSRVWPPRYPNLRVALDNFRAVLGDLLNIFDKYSEPCRNDTYLRTEKFYKIRDFDPQTYELLSKRYDFHVSLIEDLTCETTRAANYVCDVVRECLDRSFRIEQGVLLLRTGMDIEMREHTYRLEYSAEERGEEYPYPGLNEFLNARASRGIHFGKGHDPT